ncbi:MAG: T9SS type A sorting domain-containing protein [Flavobacteriales bacterium]|nr:T9SS type A sorting domain-containing protein [Flavobacteriales bacterium]
MLIIATLTGLPDAEAQWVKFTVESTAGIPALSVRDIVKGNSTDLWFATENGAFRRYIDSDTWIDYNTSNSNLPSNSVNDIHNIGGVVLFATDNGIAIWQLNTFTTIGVADGLPSPFIQGISGTSAVTFWAATYGGGLVRQVNGIRSYYSTDTGLPTNYFRCVFRSSDGAYWFGSANHGAVRFHAEQWTAYTVDDGLAGNTILAIAQDAQNTLWMAGTGGLSRLVNGEWEAIQAPQGANSNIYYCLTKMPNGQLWAGGENGIDVFENGEHVQHITTADGLNANSVTSIYAGSQGKLWVGYAESGTSLRENGIWFDRSWGTGFSSKWITAMATDEDGLKHFGTDRMTYYDGDNWSNYGMTNGYSIGAASQMWKTDDGRLWAASSNRYAVKNGDHWQPYFKPTIGNGKRMVTQSDGTQWYCHADGVYRQITSGELTLFDKDLHLLGASPENILTDSVGRIWVISTNGLCYFQNQQWHCFEAPSSPKATYVLQPHSLAFSPDGNLMFVARKMKMGQMMPGHIVVELKPMLNKKVFVDLYQVDEWADYPHYQFRLASDTYGGIWLACRESYSSNAPACIRFTASGEVQRHYLANGIPSRNITAIMDDGQGHIWLSTYDKGVCRAPLLALGTAGGHVSVPRARTLLVYPNPANGRFTLEYTPFTANDEVTVHDLLGRELSRFPLTLTPQVVNAVQIDLGSLPSGTYLLRTTGQDYVPTRIIITENQ